MRRLVLTVVVVLCGVMSAGQSTGTRTNAGERDTLWGRTVLNKRLEHKRNFGGGFQFRSVAYYMDCTGGCFENPWHIGEFWFKSKMLVRGIDSYDVSVSPSKRFVLFQDREAGKIKLFDGTGENVKDAGPGTSSEELEITWQEPVHEATVQFGKIRYKVVLPE